MRLAPWSSPLSKSARERAALLTDPPSAFHVVNIGLTDHRMSQLLVIVCSVPRCRGTRTDGGAGADIRARVPAARTDPDCPCSRSSLPAERYFNSQHAKEGLRPP